MRYTNKHNFPDFVVQWLEHDMYDYDENTISATTLMKPARAYALEKQNSDNLEIDVSDVIASRYGTAIHDSVEKVNLTGCKQEKRLRKSVMNKIITGKFDILREIGPDQHELIDVKSTSVWTYIYGSKEEEYQKQLSIYRWLGLQNGYNIVPKAKIWMIFTDWSQERARKNPDYPDTRIKIKEVELWPEEQTLKYIGNRIQELEAARKQDEKDMPRCTDEELWAEADKYQVMKEGRKSALKNCKSQKEAEEFIRSKEEIKNKLSIQVRKGGVKRCKYCMVRKFCSQYRELVEAGRIEDCDK